MSFTLHDLGAEKFEFNVNLWNWRATLEVVKSFDILSEGLVRQMSYNATGVTIDQAQAHAIGENIRDQVLPKLVPNKRIFADLSITDVPDDMTLFKDDDEQWKNYSTSHDLLSDFADFCLRSKGFQVF